MNLIRSSLDSFDKTKFIFYFPFFSAFPLRAINICCISSNVYWNFEKKIKIFKQYFSSLDIYGN